MAEFQCSGVSPPAYAFPSILPSGRTYRRHLPGGVAGPFYQPTIHGREKQIKERLAEIRRLRGGQLPSEEDQR